MTMRDLTWIIPYYRSRAMLHIHGEMFRSYPQDILDHLRIIYVDDGSPEDERPDVNLRNWRRADLGYRIPNVRLLRIEQDIPWNQHGARNLGMSVAETFWCLLTDMDRGMEEKSLRALLTRKLDQRSHHKPVSILVTRQGQQPAPRPVNQFVVSREQYATVGGYDEDYCGSYGGDGPFLKTLAKMCPLKDMHDVQLLRFTNDVVRGSETTTLDRKGAREEYGRRYHDKMKRGDTIPRNPLRFAWKEVPLT